MGEALQDEEEKREKRGERLTIGLKNEKKNHDAHKGSKGVIPEVLREMSDHSHGQRQFGHSSSATSSMVVATGFSRVRVGWKHSGVLPIEREGGEEEVSLVMIIRRTSFGFQEEGRKEVEPALRTPTCVRHKQKQKKR